MTTMGSSRRSAVVELGGYRPDLGGEVPANIKRVISRAVLQEVFSTNRQHPGATSADFTPSLAQISSTLAEVVISYTPQHTAAGPHKVIDCLACVAELRIPVAALECEAVAAGVHPALVGGWL